jgi:hypothetical protein
MFTSIDWWWRSEGLWCSHHRSRLVSRSIRVRRRWRWGGEGDWRLSVARRWWRRVVDRAGRVTIRSRRRWPLPPRGRILRRWWSGRLGCSSRVTSASASGTPRTPPFIKTHPPMLDIMFPKLRRCGIPMILMGMHMSGKENQEHQHRETNSSCHGEGCKKRKVVMKHFPWSVWYTPELASMAPWRQLMAITKS